MPIGLEPLTARFEVQVLGEELFREFIMHTFKVCIICLFLLLASYVKKAQLQILWPVYAFIPLSSSVAKI